jgi:GNAT superfamily N-acetyltransferase
VSRPYADRGSGSFELRPARYDSPDAMVLTEQAQLFYVELYGGPDETPFTVDEFAPPQGGFYVGYFDGRPVAMGGWRFSPVIAPAGATRPAEIKRMFVRSDVRRQGLARRLLAALEATALDAGADWMILETGQPQVAAVALYRASGYVDIAPFGFYADQPSVVSLGKRLQPGGLSSDA